ncbi:MAG: Spy/CpxP family protein refolding chaperone [Cyanobacteria bacterium SBLK]|nr:Spy/CpxP family protein refolding chaperone [Cyanobacteria bacterium SBLK]
MYCIIGFLDFNTSDRSSEIMIKPIEKGDSMFVQKLSILSAFLLIFGGSTALANAPDLASANRENPISTKDIQLAQNRPGRGQRGEQLAEMLDLTEDQQQEIQEIRQSYRSQIQQNRQTVQTIRQEISDLFATNASAEQLRDKQRELNQIQMEINTLNFESMLEVREILTLEQREKFSEVLEQRGNNRPRRSGSNR